MTTVATAARIWNEAGVSTIPILANGTKRPAVRWAEFQQTIPTLAQLDQWFGTGQDCGLAIICGKVSGNLELIELEGRTMDPDALAILEKIIRESGCEPTWELLMGVNGYSEWSPSGGLHLLYRIPDRDVPGNTKLAQDAGAPPLVLAETRGEGGYVIVAPSGGSVHPTGLSWELILGKYGRLPEISWEDRCRLHEAITQALDLGSLDRRPVDPTAPAPLVVPPSPQGSGTLAISGAGLSPGDDYEAKTDWTDILVPHGWTLESRHGRECHWTRPGKHRNEGHSATTGHADDRDRLYVFSTSTVFDAEQSYTKFSAYTVLNHNGDHSEAAKALARKGYGDRPLPSTLDVLPEVDQDYSNNSYTFDDTGNAMRLWDQVKNRYHFIIEEKVYFYWSGQIWRRDATGSLIRDMIRCTERMAAEAQDVGNEAFFKFARTSRNRNKIQAACEMMASLPTVSRSIGDFNVYRHKVNVGNGVLDLHTHELVPHATEFYMTRLMGASYYPNSSCPNFDKFISEILPIEYVRNYVQRAIGYTILGNADQRAIFLACGPSGTGKSQFVEAMRMVFGDYATTAPAGTFRSSREKTPTNDLHTLRGKRFIATSETTDAAAFDEELIKRLTGRDQVASRGLYQEFQEWTPECSIWFTTNYPPRFNSDDDAIWRRAKLIPFTTQFGRDGVHEDIPDFARTVLAAEVDGILNWVLEGVAAFLAYGLDEPDEVQEAGKSHRTQVDPVMRFVDDCMVDGVLVIEPDQWIKPLDLYHIYENWCRSSGERPLGSRRFANRLLSSSRGLTQEKVAGQLRWIGIGRAPGVSILGSMVS